MQTELIPITLNPPASAYERSEGIHVSSVIRAMALNMGVLKPEWARDQLGLVELPDEAAEWWDTLDEESRIRISIGMAWEAWYVPNQGYINHQPGELCIPSTYVRRGMFATPDGDGLDTIYGPSDETLYELVLHEVKTTSKSTKTVGDLMTQWMWLAQCKSYCKGLGVLVAYLHVLFLYGDYKKPYRPQLKCWRITFTQEEIDANWSDIEEYVRDHQLAERTEDVGLEGGV